MAHFYNDHQKHNTAFPNNVILIGVTGSGKSSSGWLLAHLIGFGFIDLDQMIEETAKKSVAQIFAESGADHFRQLEKDAVQQLKGIRHSVIAVGGGGCVDPENWETFTKLGTIVWLNCPPLEIAKRLLMKPDELRRRPLLADLVEISDKLDRLNKLNVRINELIESRSKQYAQAELTLNCAHATRETMSHLLRDLVMSRAHQQAPDPKVYS